MLQRVRQRISSTAAVRAAQAQTARRKKITRRRLKHPATNDETNSLEHSEGDDDLIDDTMSVGSQITVETTRTASNENRKLTADPTAAMSTQILVTPSEDPSQHPVEVLERAQSDITKLSVYLQDLPVTQPVAAALLTLVRGDNRSWEAIAVDILRQKARWDSITLEDCRGTQLDTMIGYLIHLDVCGCLHLSNLALTTHSAWCLQSVAFTKSMTKLQLDLIDLTFCLPLLCEGLHHNTSITTLITSRCGLSDEPLAKLFSHLPKYLEELRIFGNKCRGKGLAAITSVIQHSQHLKVLDLSYQHVTDAEQFDISWLAGVLHHNKTLRVLDLDNDGIDDGHLTHLCAALCANSTLEEVMLNHNRITSTGIALLSSKFSQMQGLKKISMYSNLFEAPQVSAVVEESLSQPQQRSTDNLPNEVTVGGDTKEEEVEGMDDDEEDDEADYDEESVSEEEIMLDDEKGEGDNDEEEDSSYMDDNSSAPPPSADFREPEEVEADQFLDEEDNSESAKIS